MPINLPCPSCSATLEIPESVIGKATRCSACQTVFRAEMPVRTKGKLMPVVIGAAVTVVVGIIAWGAWSFLSTRSNTQARLPSQAYRSTVVKPSYPQSPAASERHSSVTSATNPNSFASAPGKGKRKRVRIAEPLARQKPITTPGEQAANTLPISPDDNSVYFNSTKLLTLSNQRHVARQSDHELPRPTEPNGESGREPLRQPEVVVPHLVLPAVTNVTWNINGWRAGGWTSFSQYCRVTLTNRRGNGWVGVGVGPVAEDRTDQAYKDYRDMVRANCDKLNPARTAVRTSNAKINSHQYDRYDFEARGYQKGTLFIGVENGRCVSYWFYNASDAISIGVGKAKIH